VAWRAIHDDVPYSDSLNSVSDFAERLYWRMLAVSDTCGRGPGSAAKIAGLCTPRLAKSTDEIRDALDSLVRVGRIVLYCENGSWAYYIVGFGERQPVAHFGKRLSRFPSPPPGAVRAAPSSDAVPTGADAVPLFDQDAAPVEKKVSLTQLSSGSPHTEQSRAEERRPNHQSRASTADSARSRAQEPAALVNESLEDWSARVTRKSAAAERTSSPFLRLLAVLPDRDENSQVVLRKYLEALPAHAADLVREEVLAAGVEVRRPTAYAVGILKRWASQRRAV
jgi:hypothetical protein